MGIKNETWVAWIGAIIVAAVVCTYGVITFAYGNFETKDQAKERAAFIVDRLQKIEDKLDRVLQIPTRR